MKVTIENGVLKIELPISPHPSKSGKTMVIASTNGNIPSTVQHEGKVVVVGVNAYVAK